MALSPPQELLERAESLCAEARWDEGLIYGQWAIAAAPDSVEVLRRVASLYEQSGQLEWAQMLQQTAQNINAGRSDVPG